MNFVDAEADATKHAKKRPASCAEIVDNGVRKVMKKDVRLSKKAEEQKKIEVPTKDADDDGDQTDEDDDEPKPVSKKPAGRDSQASGCSEVAP